MRKDYPRLTKGEFNRIQAQQRIKEDSPPIPFCGDCSLLTSLDITQTNFDQKNRWQHPPTREKPQVTQTPALMSAQQSLETHYGKTLYKSLPTLSSPCTTYLLRFRSLNIQPENKPNWLLKIVSAKIYPKFFRNQSWLILNAFPTRGRPIKWHCSRWNQCNTSV